MLRRVPIRSPSTRTPSGATNTYVLGDLLVDPAGRHPDLDRIVEARPIEHVVVTHTHPDHVGAVAEYAASAEATAWAPKAFADRFENATGMGPDATFEDGDVIGDVEATAIGTPGHAIDHVAFAVDCSDEDVTFAVDHLDEEDANDPDHGGQEVILSGDLAVADGSVVVGPDGGGLRTYLESLRRLRDRDPAVLYPGHGPAIDDPEATLNRLIHHRLDRERSILDAIETGASDVSEVLDRAYEKDLTGVEDLARETVRAHLEKLIEEGRIDDSWHDRV
ncbi:MBL fold metallo-hydrolase [Halopenitus sp. H-Gu1]|uniref:MBL fold metallo-hydrolase n=1 Tax=Halopenitus sp. H-Gu1 TaxID=3242697 RepID=UPI00359DD24B